MGAKVAQVVAAHLITTAALDRILCVSYVVSVSPAPATTFQLLPDMRKRQLHAYDGTQPASFVAHNVLTLSPINEREAVAENVENFYNAIVGT